ncbi:T9SS type A sorting domain-containing protein [candidate division WOR-3 bacterium]|nr:T9SS type A sorting domain-containing protein [candidate division WOR-3 bacterium]
MKKFLLIFMCLFITSTLWAGNAFNDETLLWSSMKESKPIWTILEGMNAFEKENSIIDIEVTNDVIMDAGLIEENWNSGYYDNAIRLLQESKELHSAGIGIQWKEPIKTGVKWGDDARIGSRDTIRVVALDVDNSTGNLFAVVKYNVGSGGLWAVNISTDTGKTWSETYNWGSIADDIDAVVLHNYLYVAYSVTAGTGRIRRFSTTNGSVDAGYGFQTAIDEGIDLRDVALTSTADNDDQFLLYFAIMDNDFLREYWSDTLATSWVEFSPVVSNADRGLDACATGPPNYMWASYIGTNDSLYVVGAWGFWSYWGPMDYIGTVSIAKTSIAAYGDTIMSTYPHYDGSYYNLRYRVSYTGGAAWTYGTIDAPTEYIGIMNDISGRNGDGFGVVYQNEGGAAEGFYRHRTYHLSPWTSPVSFADSVTRYNVKPAIERVASGVYGIIYVNYPHEFAYFDRSDWISGIDEETPDLDGKIARLLGNSPNPFNQNTTIRYLLANTEKVSLKIYDISGKLIKTLVEDYRGPGEHSITWYGRNNNGNQVPSGIYFSRISVGDFAESKKMIFIK